MEREIEKVAELLKKKPYTVVFTGAGISAESGIPTFRGSTGLWSRYNPEEVVSLSGFKKNPERFWQFVKDTLFKLKAKPNPAHYAISELEKIKIVKSVITQNIDRLHQQAGSRRVIELHGSMEYVDCLSCGKVYKWEEIEKKLNFQLLPICDFCKSIYLKPRVVFFEEPLPEEAMKEALEETNKSEVFIVVGSSLVVYPAAHYPYLAKKKGANLILINKEPTDLDFIFDIKIFGKAGEILPKIVEKLKNLSGN